jgi:hypothetical protein
MPWGGAGHGGEVGWDLPGPLMIATVLARERFDMKWADRESPEGGFESSVPEGQP